MEAEDVGEHCKGGICRIENAGGDSSQCGKPAPCGAGTPLSLLVHSLPHFLPFFPFIFSHSLSLFTARRSYASAVLGVVILSICHTHAL